MSPLYRRLLVVPVTAGALVLAASPAWAHVEVESGPAGPDGTVLTFHVPNEEAPATTTSVLLGLPDGVAFGAVTPEAENGWTPTVSGSQVTWTGGHITGTDEVEFHVRVAQLPTDRDTLTFKVLQGYDNGQTVAWIETAPEGAPEPEHPAPVLDVRTGHAVEAGEAATPDPVATAAPVAAAPAVTAATAPAPAAHESGSSAPLIGGLAALAAAVGLGGFLVARRRRRATPEADAAVRETVDR